MALYPPDGRNSLPIDYELLKFSIQYCPERIASGRRWAMIEIRVSLYFVLISTALSSRGIVLRIRVRNKLPYQLFL
jgi:hypothetical protein